MYLIAIAVVLAVALVAYVRFAPTDVARWHQPVTATTGADMASGAIRVIAADPGALARVDAAMRAMPRTQVLAGSLDEGRITYVTRSATVRFPDYTTVEYSDGMVRMYARLRFGRSDFGVNRERLQRLLRVVEGG